MQVIEVCRAANPRLRILRARFSALVARELHHGKQGSTMRLPHPVRTMLHRIRIYILALSEVHQCW